MATKFSFHGKQVIIRSERLNWEEPDKFLNSALFSEVLRRYLEKLRSHNSDLLRVFPKKSEKEQQELVLLLLKELSKKKKEQATRDHPELSEFFSDIYTIDQFVEELYNFWRSFERYLVTTQGNGIGAEKIDEKPYRTFNDTIERINHTVRGIYRDIRENITGEHPVIFRQVPAGCPVGVIATQKQVNLPKDYDNLKNIRVITQVLIEPPLMIDPPTNTRKGEFALVDSNPLEGLGFDTDEWLCFPAKVGELVVYLYFHSFFTGLGIATANLFELCSEEDLKKKPDAVYAYGVPIESVAKYAPEKTVFYDDKKNGIMSAAIPLGNEFGYFGYVKKIMLTLYNSIMIKRGRMPVHGAMTRITLKNGKAANVIIFGDTGTGKSESLEAFRKLSGEHLKDMKIIFDDMGSLEIDPSGKIRAYGTETGAFVRLDDLDSGYAFHNLDRSIIMSPQKVNARAVLPITTMEEVLKGYGIDYYLYANNYDRVTDGTYLKRFGSAQEAMSIFKEGKRMAKGTTNETGLVGAYYANIFGPSQFKAEHDVIAGRFFSKMFETNTYVGQIRTQLGVKGMEMNGPENAAKALFEEIMKK